MRIRQYNLGYWLGAYYIQLMNGLSLYSVVNSLVGLTVLWAVASDKILQWFPWLSYGLFMAIVFFCVLVVAPLGYHILFYRTTQMFQTQATYNMPENPYRADMAEVKSRLAEIEKAHGIESKYDKP